MSELKINFDQFTARNIDDPDSETSKALGQVLVGGVDEFTAENIANPESLTGKALAGVVDGTIANGVTDIIKYSPFTADQIDYVSLLSETSPYDTVTVTRIDSAGSFYVTCQNAQGLYVRHRFGSPSRYQYAGEIAVSGELTGEYQEKSSVFVDEIVLTGTWLGVTSTPYTTTVGNSWEADIVTTKVSAKVDFRVCCDNRGGMWQPRLNGVDHGSPYSCYGSGSKVVVDAIEIPSVGNHKVGARFLGHDPAHPEVVSPRGWLYIATSENFAAVMVNETGKREVIIICPTSSKDIALSVKPVGGVNNEFIPYHGSATESFVEMPRYFDQGVEFNISDLTVNIPRPVTQFEIVQHIKGHNLSSGAQGILDIWSRQTIDKSGVLSVTGRWRTNVPIVMSRQTYHGMFPATLPIFTEAINSLGKSYDLPSEPSAGSIQTPDGDSVGSWAYMGADGDTVAALTIQGRMETLRMGQEGKRPVQSQTFIELKTGGVLAKVYQSLYANDVVVPTGTTNKYAAKWYYGVQPGIVSTLSDR